MRKVYRGIAAGIAGLSLGAACGGDGPDPNETRKYEDAQVRISQETLDFVNYTSALPENCRKNVLKYILGTELEALPNDEATKLTADACPENPEALVDVRWLFGNIMGDQFLVDGLRAEIQKD